MSWEKVRFVLRQACSETSYGDMARRWLRTLLHRYLYSNIAASKQERRIMTGPQNKGRALFSIACDHRQALISMMHHAHFCSLLSLPGLALQPWKSGISRAPELSANCRSRIPILTVPFWDDPNPLDIRPRKARCEAGLRWWVKLGL